MDATLEAAGAEILAVLKKHDIAGVAFLTKADASKHVADFSPSWSCAKTEDASIRLCAQLSEFPDKETQTKCVTNTLFIFVAFRQLAMKLAQGMGDILRYCDKDAAVQAVIDPNKEIGSRIIKPPGY